MKQSILIILALIKKQLKKLDDTFFEEIISLRRECGYIENNT